MFLVQPSQCCPCMCPLTSTEAGMEPHSWSALPKAVHKTAFSIKNHVHSFKSRAENNLDLLVGYKIHVLVLLDSQQWKITPKEYSSASLIWARVGRLCIELSHRFVQSTSMPAKGSSQSIHSRGSLKLQTFKSSSGIPRAQFRMVYVGICSYSSKLWNLRRS